MPDTQIDIATTMMMMFLCECVSAKGVIRKNKPFVIEASVISFVSDIRLDRLGKMD